MILLKNRRKHCSHGKDLTSSNTFYSLAAPIVEATECRIGKIQSQNFSQNAKTFREGPHPSAKFFAFGEKFAARETKNPERRESLRISSH